MDLLRWRFGLVKTRIHSSTIDRDRVDFSNHCLAILAVSAMVFFPPGSFEASKTATLAKLRLTPGMPLGRWSGDTNFEIPRIGRARQALVATNRRTLPGVT